MKKKSLFWVFAMMLVLSVFLAACNKDDGKETDASKEKEEPTDEEVAEEEPKETGPVKGGTLFYGIDAEPEGQYSSAFYEIATDFEVIEFFDEPIINYD